tara:strand:- start:58 stop:312 length:255 start_codon:yes stop_codon:yes gene_type:complete
MMANKINIYINDSSIGLKLNEFWYFHYYLKNISEFYNQTQNQSKKILISFPGTSLQLVAGQKEIENISNQVKSYINISSDQFKV